MKCFVRTQKSQNSQLSDLFVVVVVLVKTRATINCPSNIKSPVIDEPDLFFEGHDA